ncbi:hypothetical protein D3C87_1908430 [compost metagenome]
MKVPGHGGAGLQPPPGAASGEIARQLAGIGHRLEHVMHRLVDPTRHAELQLQILFLRDHGTHETNSLG